MVQTQREPQARDVTLSNGLRMRYYQWPGPGANLVLLHPSAGYALMWDETVRHLGGQFQVIAPDQRGHGDTDRPDGSYSAEEYAEDLHLFVTELGLEKAIICGHSLGGRVSQVFAATHPEQAQAMVLVGGPHYSNFFQERDRANTVLEGAERMRGSQTEFPSREAVLTYLREFRPRDSEEALLHRIEHNTRPLPGGGVAFKYDKVRVAQGMAHMADNLRVYAPRVSCPVAIILGSHSIQLSREEAEYLAAFWKDTRIFEVGGSYVLEYEDPVGVAQAILAFSRQAVPA